MTVNLITVAPASEVRAIEQTAEIGAGASLARRVLLALAIVALLSAGAYSLAWYRAANLAATFMADADRSYAAGKYIEALTGYEEFDPATNSHVTRGGYMSVARIWADPQAWPRPAAVAQAQAHIDEILDQKLTIEDAEGFIQAHVGKPNLYMGTIYLRLGELYEQAGDHDSATAIYSDIANLFPNEVQLIARAQEHLSRLPSK
jgi:tetratricopeptide (TPR) repeat protein